MEAINWEYKKDFEGYAGEVMAAYGAAGLAVSVFSENDTLYEHFFGYRDAENKLPLNGDTIFGMASISKSFTCLSIMQLAEKGLIDLDGLVSDYIPEFTGQYQQQLKVHHLMSHSGGFYPEKRLLARDIAKEAGLFDKVPDIAYSAPLAQKGIALVAGRLDGRDKLIGRPGTYMSYSNDSYGLLSDIIRRCGGECTLPEYINKYILAPLGMERSSMEFEKPARDGNCTTLYYKKDGVLVHDKDFYNNAFVLMGGGAIKSTVNDMKKYVRMYLGEGVSESGSRILGGYFAREMVKPRQLYNFQEYYGYGLSTRFVDDITVIGHGGSLPGVSTEFLWSPQLKIGAVVFCNTSDVPVKPIGEALLRWFNSGKPCMVHKLRNRAWGPETVKAAVGRYVSEEGAIVEIYEKDGIGVRLNHDEVECYTALPDLIVIKKPYNNVNLMVLREAGQEAWGIRIGGRIIPKAIE